MWQQYALFHVLLLYFYQYFTNFNICKQHVGLEIFSCVSSSDMGWASFHELDIIIIIII